MVAMASLGAVAASATLASPASASFSGLRSLRPFAPANVGAAVAGVKAAASKHKRGAVVVAADNVEQKQTEDQEQEKVVQEALEDAMLNVAEPQKLLSSREGLEEKFAVLNTGAYECRSCGHVYEEQKGDSSFPVAAGTLFRDLPEDWLCPTCGAAKSYYKTKSVEVAGFAQNQQYGLGGNALTGGQKSLLIYGSLLFFFALFLSGYFLQ